MDFIPITPEQWRHLNELNISNPHLDNVSRLFIVPPDFDFAALKDTIHYLLQYHDALRLRFVHGPSGWQQYITDCADAPVHWRDLSFLSDLEQREILEAEVTMWQTSLNIIQGPLFQVVYFYFGTQRPGRLLLTFHHLIVDLYSVNILLRDFMRVHQQISNGEEVHLPLPTMPFWQWAKELKALAQSPLFQNELEDYWLTLPWERIVPLPVDFPVRGWNTNTRASARDISLSLSKHETNMLLGAINVNIQVLDVLLAALYSTVTRWTHSSALYVAVINHGRMIFDSMNVTRTIGLIACLSHMFLDVKDVYIPCDVLQAIKAEQQRVPHQGVGHGLLKYLTEDLQIAEKLQHVPRCEIILNYFGIRRTGTNLTFQMADENQYPTLDPRNIRPQVIAIEAEIKEDKLQMRFRYSENMHFYSTILSLAQSYKETLKEIISYKV